MIYKEDDKVTLKAVQDLTFCARATASRRIKRMRIHFNRPYPQLLYISELVEYYHVRKLEV